jgi:hypothetical protein
LNTIRQIWKKREPMKIALIKSGWKNILAAPELTGDLGVSGAIAGFTG